MHEALSSLSLPRIAAHLLRLAGILPPVVASLNNHLPRTNFSPIFDVPIKPALYDSESFETAGNLTAIQAPLSLSIGVVLMGFPFFGGGAEVLIRWALSTDGPAWLVSIGLFLMGVGLTVYSMLLELIRDREASPDAQLLTRWVAAAAPRVALTLVAVNMPLAAYLGALHQFHYFADWVLLAMVIGVNAAAQGAALATTPKLRPQAAARIRDRARQAIALEEHVGCAFCSSRAVAPDSDACRRCERLHQKD